MERYAALSLSSRIPQLLVISLMPEALRIADKFHVIRHANQAVDQVRRRVQGRGLKKGKARKLFSCRYSLLRAIERARPGDADKLAEVFAIAPELQVAWRLKEDLRDFYACTDPQQIREALDYWYRAVEDSEIPEFQKVAKMIRNWESEVLAYFGHRMTNAFAEGITNKIKVVKRQAYGMRNFANFQERIMVQCGMPK